MIIEKLKVKNYRNFKDFEIKLKPFTLIIGENNIGKTNLLNAIGLIFSQEITFFKRRMLDIDDINYDTILEFKKDVISDKHISEIQAPLVEVEAVLGELTRNQQNLVQDWFIDDTFKTAKIKYKFYNKVDLSKWIEDTRTFVNTFPVEERIAKVDFPIDKYGFLISGGEDDTSQIDFYFLKALKFEFLDALRDAKTELIGGGDYRLLYKILSNRGNNTYDNVKTILHQLDDAIKKNDELISVKEDIKKYLTKTSLVEDDNHNSVKFAFAQPNENEMLKKLSLQYENSPVNVERNGTGRNNLLYISLILSHLLYKNNSEIMFRIIGVEEPESHLHPHLQEHLSKNIKNEPFETEQKDKLQIIVTSHCPHITSKLKLENTAILYRTPDGIKNCYFIDNFEGADGKVDAKSKDHIRYLERYLDATKSTMFFGRKIILVEGIAEQIVIPKLFEIHSQGKTLEKVGCTLVNVSGVGFRHFLEVIKRGFFIKCLALTDSDSGTKNKDRAENLENDYTTCTQIKISITEQSTFEKDIINANKTGTSKKIMLNALKLTRRNKGGEFERNVRDNEINVEDYFGLIEDGYKAEFAMDLLSTLNENSTDFNIPQYIKDGFDFLLT